MSFNKSLRAEKIRKLQELRAEGTQAYGYKFCRTHTAYALISRYDHLDPGQVGDEEIRVCGRIMHQRYSWTFIDLADESGSVQLYCNKSLLREQLVRQLRLLDRGDIIGVSGRAIRTKQGPPSVLVENLEILAKSLEPLPDDPAALNDTELRYRNRHLDLLLRDGARSLLHKRSLTIRSIRRFLDDKGFVEVETPVLHVQAGGAEAKPFVTHHNALDIDMHLRIAPEFYLRRLLVGGMEKVYEIGKNFRNESITSRHNPEFTSIELFQAYCDYNELMDLTEHMIREVAERVCGNPKVDYQGCELDFGAPFRRIAMTDVIEEKCGVNVDAITDIDQMRAIASELRVDLSVEDSCGEIINAIFEQKIQATLIQPTFVTDYPVEVSVCQQLHRTRPGYVERFELFVFGRELANGCSELNDPHEQKRRFEAQARKKANGQDELPAPDLDFLVAMEFGMPPMMGLGVGIDRLVMLLVNARSIRDVLAFPTMKPLPRVARLTEHYSETGIKEVG